MGRSSKLKKLGVIHDTVTGYDFEVDAPLTRKRAIRLKCLECCAGNGADVRRCGITGCTLWPYRLGKASRSVGNDAK